MAPCVADYDTMLLTITTSPTANAGSDQSVCANNAVTVMAGSVNPAISPNGAWITLGTGTFNDTTLLAATYTPSPADTVAGFVDLVLFTEGTVNCNEVSDTMRLTITPAPIVGAGINQSVCANNDTVSLTGTVTSPATGGVWTCDPGPCSGSFIPNNITLGAQYVPSAADTTAGTVSLVLTTSGSSPSCIEVTDTMVS